MPPILVLNDFLTYFQTTLKNEYTGPCAIKSNSQILII